MNEDRNGKGERGRELSHLPHKLGVRPGAGGA